MCCFSQSVEIVADTNIFARSANDQQFLVYGMSYAAPSELAMALPLPVSPGSSEDAVRFINLQSYPTFFDDLRQGFQPMMSSLGRGAAAAALATPKLHVHDVGDFEASFVPRIADFDRLDKRFRIPLDVWDQLPAYHDYGFAVFKLKASDSGWPPGWLKGSSRSYKLRRVHPMAFAFPRRNPGLLYFPTVHVHDREVHPHATFDHTLYCQAGGSLEKYLHLQEWHRSRECASSFMDVVHSEGIVDADQYCWRLSLKGRLQNKDTLVGPGGVLPEA